MKNKIKLLYRYPLTVSLSSDRTQYQSDHKNKREIDLTIKFVRGVPAMMQKSVIINVHNSQKTNVNSHVLHQSFT